MSDEQLYEDSAHWLVVVVVVVIVVVAHGSWSSVSVWGVCLLPVLQLHPVRAGHDSTSVRWRATPAPHPALTVVQAEGMV